MNHFRLGSYMRFYLLKEKFNSFNNKKILDVGCNYGEIEKILSLKNNIIGIDVDKKALKIAKKTIKNAKFIEASATKLPFGNQCFDVVICLAVLEHIKEDNKAIKELSRVLKKGGELLLAVPNENAELIPKWLSPELKLINKIFKTKFPISENEYLHFGQEGIGHVRRGYSIKNLKNLLLSQKLTIKKYTTYWHFPSRFAYLIFMPLIRKGIIKENLAKRLFSPFLFLDKIFPDKKGDILIFAVKK